VILFLACIPFVGIALLLWKGPRSLAARRYSQAIVDREMTRDELEAARIRLAEACRRLAAAQHRLAAQVAGDDEPGND